MNDVSTSLSGQPVAQDTAKRPSHGLWTGHRLALSHSLSPNALKTYSGPRRRLLVAAALVAGDVVAALVATSPGGALVAGAAATYPVAAVTAAFLIAAYFGLGLYAGYGPSPCERFRLRALGVLAFFAADLLVAASVGFNVGALAAAVCTGVLLLVLGYYTEGIIRRLLVQRDLWGATAALVGCDEGSSKLAKRLMAEPELGLRPLGFVSEDTDQQPGTLPLPFLGTLRDMARVGEQAEVLIFASRRRLTVDETAWRSHIGKVLVVEDAQDLQSLWLNTRTLGSSVGVEIRRGLYVAPNLWLKRGIDILIALPVGLLVLPLIGVLALVIKTVDPGPAFYVQSRVGRAGRPLRVVKLRTMYRDAERRLEDQLGQDPAARAEWQRYFKLSNDPRVLPNIGNFIRRTSLDELPQLWNVVRGDMSLVGPRPFPAYHTNSFEREFQTVRESVPPGLTGLWQVSSRSDGDLDIQKAQDLFYIRNWSIWLDFYLMLQTLPAVLSAKGAK